MVDEPDENHLHSEKKTNKLGYTTQEALKVLCDEIETTVKLYEKKFHNESWLTIAKSGFAKPYESPLSWFSILTTISVIVCLALTKHYFTSICVLLILVATVTIVIFESYLRRTEIFRKIRLIINEIELAQKLCNDWTPDNYPNVCNPLSPCVTLQLCYRDGRIVNLPWALLVRNDVIIMRPGQISPGDCTEIAPGKLCKFKKGETYGLAQPLDAPVRPTVRHPLPDLTCTLDKTPFLDNLKKILDKSPKRPPTIYNQQRHLLITKYIQHWGVIACLLMTLLFAALNYNDKLYDDRFVQLKWMNLFLELPLCAILPVIPLMFPIMWISINLWGIARLETHLAQPQVTTKLDQQRSFQEDLDTPTMECETAQLSFKEVFFNWLRLWRGYSMLLGRSSNVVQVLGSVTALCCVDKKGILSWPNPTAEKVFILRDADEDTSQAESETSFDSHNKSGRSNDKKNNDTTNAETKSINQNDADNGDETIDEMKIASKRNSGRIIDTHKHPGTIAEVLDLTHDQVSPFRIDFDDASWKKHIDSLKPLGLAILVNTCCQKTQEHYSKFCAHVTAVATLDKDLVPATNRRCLCELAKQIGFTEKAADLFSLEGQIASYMHLQPEVVKRDIRFARQLRIASKVKVPFPHCLSVVIRDLQSNSLQMLTQGTADIVLDSCDDFWDGHDLRPLGLQERKRAQDFYQRNALTSYCTAFAYRPLRHGIVGALAETSYMELPPETVYKTSAHRDHERGGIFCTFDGAPNNCEPVAGELKHSISTDSLLFSEHNKEEDVHDVDGCFEMQCHQIFIGMVTMQYQAQTDMISMIERLERACIRFVHFSKENEVRSRVFSEKMGLESGWNCHISLLSDDHSNVTSPRSQSRDFNYGGPVSNCEINVEDEATDASELNRLLPPLTGLESTKNLSSSAPGAISEEFPYPKPISSVNSIDSSQSGAGMQRISKDSAMEDENCRSMSGFTDSTEQSAAINFDMSNRAKLPRGIKNIRPHLENVDNVPLLVSLFTDCSAEATREMLTIMQSYGEIVVCIGSSASCSNVESFIEADCSIAIEPLYPQVCQNIPPYTESNILNNRNKVVSNDAVRNKSKWFEYEPTRFQGTSTISPIYLSRQLNAIPCSVAVCREDSFSILGMIELSRRFSNGLWNCIQFWVCCGCMLAIINTICACLALPPILTPFTSLYLMCVIVPLISTTLVNNEANPDIMNRATGKKHPKFNPKVIVYVMCSYGFKFLPSIIIMVLTYSMLMAHPLDVLDLDMENFYQNLDTSRCFIFYAIILHFVIISMSFVHRDHSIWNKNPFTNSAWFTVCTIILIVHTCVFALNLIIYDKIIELLPTIWPIVLFLIGSIFIVYAIVEFCKWQELKANIRYQRRARLDFGTKLGMNSPF